jgi:hypothetical protein
MGTQTLAGISRKRRRNFEAMVQEAEILGEKYRLEARIAEGGMGAVWRARHVALGHIVAIKILPPGRSGSDGVVERFLQEARIIAGIRHRNVIGIVDFGTIEGNRPYIVMEHLDGEPLSARLRRSPDLSFGEVIVILSDVLGGLASVHATGILHGDVKPENVFLAVDAEGALSAKLIDFGVSRSIHESDESARLAGTPPYMAPEQLQRDSEVDTRADLYAVGVMAYEIFGGAPPYSGRDVSEIIAATVRGGAKPVRERRPELDERLALFIDRAISTMPAKRFFSAKEMRAALLEIAGAIAPELATADRVTPTFIVSAAAHAGGAARARADAPTPAAPLYSSSAALDALAPLVSEATQQIDHRTMVMPMPKRPKRGVLPFVGAGAAIVVVSAAAGLMMRSPESRASGARTAVTAEVAPARGTPPQAAPQPAAVAAPAPAPATVSLQGLPDDAIVYVDDARTTLADGTLSFARDGRVHSIEVRAPGRVSWRVGYLARTNASYHVVLEEAGAPAAAVAPQTGDAPAEPARRVTKRASDSSSLTRDPGF